MSARAWLRAARPLAHVNIAPPLMLGQAAAWALGLGFEAWMAALAMGFGVLDHLFIVFTNDVADRRADALNESPTLFSGGSRVLQQGAIRPRTLTTAALLAALSLLILSIVGALAGRPWLPLFALAAIALLAAYSVPPLRLSYRGYGELLQGLGVGLVLPLVGFYCQAGRLDVAPWPLFAPLVLLGFVSNILTALPDTPADRAADKHTWPVRRGEMRARRDALVLLGVGLMLVSQLGPPLSPAWTAAVVVPPAILALGALRYLRRADAKSRADCLRFVGLAAGAITLLQLGWTAALTLGAP